MRLMPNIRFGTEGYPEKIARRLRATNIAAWIGAATLGLFAVLRFVQGFAHWKYAALVGVAFGLAPLLHRFGALAAPLGLTAIMYAWVFWLSINGGVANGTTFIYFMAGALGILLIGAERVSLSVLIGAVAVEGVGVDEAIPGSAVVLAEVEERRAAEARFELPKVFCRHRTRSHPGLPSTGALLE